MRKIKIFTTALILLLTAVCGSVNAQSNDYRKELQKYLDAKLTAKNEIANMDLKKSFSALHQQILLGFDEDRLNQLLERYRRERLADDMMECYYLPMMQGTVSIEELRELTVFYQSPEGQVFQQHELEVNQKTKDATAAYTQEIVRTIMRGEKPKQLRPRKEIPKKYAQKFYETFDTSVVSSVISPILNQLTKAANDDKAELLKLFQKQLMANIMTLVLNQSYGTYTEQDLELSKRINDSEAGRHANAAVKKLADNLMQYAQNWITAYRKWLREQPEVCDFYLQKIVDAANVMAINENVNAGENYSFILGEGTFQMTMEIDEKDGESVSDMMKDSFEEAQIGLLYDGSEGKDKILTLTANAGRDLVYRFTGKQSRKTADVTMKNEELRHIAENIETIKMTRQGMQLLTEEKTAEALPLLTKAAEAGDQVAQYHLALAFAEEEKPDESLKWCEKTIAGQFKSYKCEALHLQTLIYGGLEDYDKALASIDQAISMKPGNPEYYETKGTILFDSGNKSEARKMWNKVISLDPDFAKTHDSELYKLLFHK